CRRQNERPVLSFILPSAFLRLQAKLSSAEEPTDQTAAAVLLRRWCLLLGLSRCGLLLGCAASPCDRHAAAHRGVLELALQTVDLALQRSAAFEPFQFVTNLALQTLQVVARARHLGPLAGHADFHLAHLPHERLFVVLQLAPLALQLF